MRWLRWLQFFAALTLMVVGAVCAFDQQRERYLAELQRRRPACVAEGVTP